MTFHSDDLLADLETRSRTDLKKAGARRYAADPSTGITCAAWEFRGVEKTACPVHPHLGTHTLADLYEDIRQCRRFVAHHANFDVNILRSQNPFLNLPLSKIDCTMGRAQAIALPGGLDEVCTTLGVRGKDPRGRQLVMATCKPQRDGTFNEDVNTYRELVAYCLQDKRALKDVDARLPALSPSERLIFERTWRKNETGLPIDIHLATAIALRRQEIEQESTATLMELTKGPDGIARVTKLSQRQRIIEWANSGNRAAGLENTQKHVIAEKLLDENLHPDVRVVLELLQSEGGSAPLKAQALLDRHIGGYYKDATRYFGARSGRGTSEGVNTFNIARPSGRYDGKDGRPTIDSVIQGLKQGFKYDNIALTDCLRGLIVAPDGWMVCDNDASQAELRFALWLAGDQERLDILASGKDLYMYNGIRVFNLPETATKATHPKERQTAKNVTLGGNYQLGWRTYMAFLIKTAAENGLKRHEITEIKARSDIDGYRKANPKLVQLWYDLADAFKFAIYEQPGRVFQVGGGKVAFQKDAHGTVWMLLPSGRAVPHYSAHITHDGEMAFFRGKFGAMLRQKAFGGSLLEIFCQSCTRDLVTEAEADIERELPDVYLGLDVYDSILAWAPTAVAAQRSAQMREIMKRPRRWTAGLPLDCEGYEAPRMRK
jgi:DNA polymerase bacteriophage-type